MFGSLFISYFLLCLLEDGTVSGFLALKSGAPEGDIALLGSYNHT
jgi:hypothetical protein